MWAMTAVTGLSLNPPDLDGARHGYQAAAHAGNTDAMVNLAVLLADRLDPPDLDGAQYWSEMAARSGEAGAWYRLGGIFARRGDRAGVEKAWRRVIDTAGVDQQTAGASALGLAALATLDDVADMAWPLLQVARACGFAVATCCAVLLTADQAGRGAALARLAQHEEETTALNFLGLAAYRDGAPTAAIGYWRRSAGSGDPVAPLLMHLTTRANDTGGYR